MSKAGAIRGLRGFGRTKCSIGNPASAGFPYSWGVPSLDGDSPFIAHPAPVIRIARPGLQRLGGVAQVGRAASDR